MDNNVEEIKSRLDIVEVIKEYIPNLKAVGANFSALSPFKNEKTPSFVVSPDKQIWHCFSTGKGGDVISFVMELEGISFIEALRMLAPKAGVTLQKQNPQEQSKLNKLLDITEVAVNFYHKMYMESPLAEKAREYLTNRGLKEETIIEWQIGYSPDSWDDLLNVLRKRGYRDVEITEAGLATKNESRSSYYNRFRGRVMFPINDFSGNPVAFTARVSPEKEATEVMGKYINSPQTMVYDKSNILFGLDKAKMAIKSDDQVIIVEGQMDVISAHQAGFKNIVASSGTALTKQQLKLIKRYTNNIALSFDMDEAGQLAAERGIKEAMEEDMNISVITIEGGKDPDELIKNNPEGWAKSVKEAKHVMKYYFDRVFSMLDITKIDDKRKAAAKLLGIINRIKNKIEQDFWIKALSQKIDVDEGMLREALLANQKKTGYTTKTSEVNQYKEQRQERQSREELLSESLLALVLKFPHFLEGVINSVNIDYVFGQANKLFYKNLIIYYNNSNSVSEDNIQEIINYNSFHTWITSNENRDKENQLKLLEKLVVLGDKDFFDFDDTYIKNEIIKIEQSLKNRYLFFRKKEIEKLIADSEQLGDDDELNRLMEELNRLNNELKSEQID